MISDTQGPQSRLMAVTCLLTPPNARPPSLTFLLRRELKSADTLRNLNVHRFMEFIQA